MVAVEFNKVFFKYKSKDVLIDLSFKVLTGGINVLLGPNGAGKTTALQLILGLLEPQSGHLQVLGASSKLKSTICKIGYVPQDLSFPAHLETEEVLNYVLCLRDKKAAQNILNDFGLISFKKTKASLLSGGQKRRLGLALALCAQPELLILDEPTTGLDLESKIWFWKLIQTYSKHGGTVLLTTHDIYEVSAMNCEGLILNKGQAVTQGSMDFLLAKAKYKKISFQSQDEFKLDLLGDKYEKNNNWYRCWTRQPEKIIADLVSHQVSFADLQVERGSLEEVLKALESQS